MRDWCYGRRVTFLRSSLFFRRTESLCRVTTRYICRLKLVLPILYCDMQICTSSVLSEVQTHSPEWPKRGSENGGSPPTVAAVESEKKIARNSGKICTETTVFIGVGTVSLIRVRI
ncbi:unnamed protein product [Laminaria digitata]